MFDIVDGDEVSCILLTVEKFNQTANFIWFQIEYVCELWIEVVTYLNMSYLSGPKIISEDRPYYPHGSLVWWVLVTTAISWHNTTTIVQNYPFWQWIWSYPLQRTLMRTIDLQLLLNLMHCLSLPLLFLSSSFWLSFSLNRWNTIGWPHSFRLWTSINFQSLSFFYWRSNGQLRAHQSHTHRSSEWIIYRIYFKCVCAKMWKNSQHKNVIASTIDKKKKQDAFFSNF